MEIGIMTKGLEIRAQIDTESVKGLLLINGGGAVALLAFLPFVLGKPEYEPLAQAILWGLLIFQVGLVTAVIHNRLRRICSLTYEQHQYQPPPGKFLGLKLREPRICCMSTMFMWLSVIAFFVAGLFVFKGGFETLEQKQSSKQITEISVPQETKMRKNDGSILK